MVKSGSSSYEFLKWKYKQMRIFIEKLVYELKVDLLIMSKGLQEYAKGKVI